MASTLTKDKTANSPRRQQVVDAAAAIFSKLGYHGASTRAIADHLGIKGASLYFHFASKEDALEEVCALGIRRAIYYLDEAEVEAAGLAEHIRHFFVRQSEDFLLHADYMHVTIHESRFLTGEAKERIGKLSRELRTNLDRMFEQARERGELNPAITPRQARFVMVGTIRSISEIAANRRVGDFAQVMPAWTETMIRGLTR